MPEARAQSSAIAEVEILNLFLAEDGGGCDRENDGAGYRRRHAIGERLGAALLGGRSPARVSRKFVGLMRMSTPVAPKGG